MGHEWAAHIVIIDFPEASCLGKLNSLIFEECYGWCHISACSHICIVKHTWDIGLKHLVPLGNYVLFGEVVTGCCRVLVHKYTLIGVLLLICNPKEICSLFLEFISIREMQFSTHKCCNLRCQCLLFIFHSVGYNSVSFCLFQIAYDQGAIFLEYGHGRIGIDGTDLHNTLWIGPDIVLV